MSGFSDKHLKAAKIHAILMDDSSQKALLARLAAAENVIAESFDHNGKAYIGFDDWHEALEAWKISKGGAGK